MLRCQGGYVEWSGLGAVGGNNGREMKGSQIMQVLVSHGKELGFCSE